MSHAKTMTCMEVWGGCEAVDSAVTLAGLDAWVYSRPYEEAQGGGDVYYLSSCATGRINRLLVADVSGHGEGVRSVAVQLRDLMRRFVNYLDQSKFVLSMNSRFVECSSAGCFATAVVTTFFAPTRTLSVCNAGHPAPLVWRKATGEWSLLERRNAGERVANIPLGIMDLEDCEQFGVELDVGDLVLIYTDSLIEARDPSGAMLGTGGLLTLVRQVCDPEHPEMVISTLLRSIDDHTGGGLRADDATVLLLRANGTAATTSWGEFFTAQWKIAQGLGRALVGRGPLALPEMSVVNIGGALVGRLNRRWGRRRRRGR